MLIGGDAVVVRLLKDELGLFAVFVAWELLRLYDGCRVDILCGEYWWRL